MNDKTTKSSGLDRVANVMMHIFQDKDYLHIKFYFPTPNSFCDICQSTDDNHQIIQNSCCRFIYVIQKCGSISYKLVFKCRNMENRRQLLLGPFTHKLRYSSMPSLTDFERFLLEKLYVTKV